MNRSVSLICALSLILLTVVSPAGAAPTATRVNGKQLLDNSKLAVAGILKVAKTSGGRLDLKNKKQAPFWKALKEMNASLRTIGQQVTAKDKKLASTLSKGSRTLSKVKTLWPRVGVKDAKVSGYLAKLDNSYTALRSAHGAEGARARRGGPLTAPERQRLQQIQKSQADFSARLVPLQAQARRSHDRGTDAALTRLIAQSNRIATAQLAVDTLLTVAILLDDIHGEWDGYSYYVGDDCRGGWGQVDTWVNTAYDSYDTYYTETFESYSVETFSYWETSVEIHGNVDYSVTDVAASEVASLDSFDSTSFEDQSWESYSDEYVTAEAEQAVYEEADLNVDLAVDSWETEGLDVSTADELADFDHQNAAIETAAAEAEDAAADAEDAAAEAHEATADAEDAAADAEDAAADADDATAEADDAAADADDAAAEADDAAADVDDAADEADDAAADVDDAADEADDAAADVDDAADEADDAAADEPEETEEEEAPPPGVALAAFLL